MSAALCVLTFASCTPGERLDGAAPPRPANGAGAAPGAAAPVTPAAPSAGALPSSNPNVRVGITIDSTRTTIGSPVEFEVQSVTGAVLARVRAGEERQFTAGDDGRITVRAGDRTITTAAAPLRVVPRDLPFITIDGRTYRGTVLLLAPGDRRITAINVVDLEGYLLGVVPRELGKRPASEIEALKAQAVAARTYAIGNLGGHSDRGFDFYATVLDQVYGGTADEDSIVTRAVRETAGQIITWQGAPIYAYYASTCGGRTAAIEESWPGRNPLPYLRSRSDRIPGTDDHYYCETSNRFHWKTEWTRQQLLDVLATTLRAHTRGKVTDVQVVNDVRVIDRGPSGRTTLELQADGNRYVLRADSVRWVLRPTPTGGILNSSKIDDVDAHMGDHGIDRLTISGGGWGHGIGMCQVGAMARARAGQTFTQILKAYYTDVEIARLY
jgi:stage II sporulation protein D